MHLGGSAQIIVASAAVFRKDKVLLACEKAWDKNHSRDACKSPHLLLWGPASLGELAGPLCVPTKRDLDRGPCVFG